MDTLICVRSACLSIAGNIAHDMVGSDKEVNQNQHVQFATAPQKLTHKLVVAGWSQLTIEWPAQQD